MYHEPNYNPGPKMLNDKRKNTVNLELTESYTPDVAAALRVWVVRFVPLAPRIHWRILFDPHRLQRRATLRALVLVFHVNSDGGRAHG